MNRFVEDRLAGRSVRRPGRGLLGALLDGTRAGRAVVFANGPQADREAGRALPRPARGAARDRGRVAGSRAPAGFAAERDEFAARRLHARRPQPDRALPPAGAGPQAVDLGSDGHVARAGAARSRSSGPGRWARGSRSSLALNGIPVVAEGRQRRDRRGRDEEDRVAHAPRRREGRAVARRGRRGRCGTSPPTSDVGTARRAPISSSRRWSSART